MSSGFSSLVVVVLVVGLAGLAFAQVGPSVAGADAFVVKPYMQHVTTHSATFLWETPRATGAVVRYGQATMDDIQPRLDRSLALETVSELHEATIDGLSPDTRYFWRVDIIDPATKRVEVSDVYTLKTDHGTDAPFSFALFGDTQENPKVWGNLATLAWRQRPDFAVHVGDIVGDGQVRAQWVDEFLEPGHTFMARFPVFTLLGNHEGDAPDYYRYMANPAPEYYYTFTWANARFFMIDSNRDCGPGSEQHDWLEYALATADEDWLIVAHHHPPYTMDSNDYGNTFTGAAEQGDPRVRPLIELYERYGVDLVLFGHIHLYERSWPIYQGKVDHRRGVTYVDIGGAGGGLEEFAPNRSWHTAVVRRTHHYGMVDVAGDRLQVRVMDEDDRLFDRFDIVKDAEAEAEFRRQRAAVPPPAPVLQPRDTYFIDKARVHVSNAGKDFAVRYTLDGSEPNALSPLLDGAIELASSTTVSVRSFLPNGTASRVNRLVYRKGETVAATSLPAGAKPGLAWDYYEGNWERLPDYAMLKPLASGTTTTVQIEPAMKGREDGWGLQFKGYIEAPESGVYTLATTSDDGTRLYIGDELVVDNDGSHAPQTRSRQIILEKGWHSLRIDYFEDGSGEELAAMWRTPSMAELERIPAKVLKH